MFSIVYIVHQKIRIIRPAVGNMEKFTKFLAECPTTDHNQRCIGFILSISGLQGGNKKKHTRTNVEPYGIIKILSELFFDCDGSLLPSVNALDRPTPYPNLSNFSSTTYFDIPSLQREANATR